MEYRIRVQPGKEKAFQQFLKALRSLGVIEKVEMVSEPDRQPGKTEEPDRTSEELASRYRDLVD